LRARLGKCREINEPVPSHDREGVVATKIC
jgi:hypothetical protein